MEGNCIQSENKLNPGKQNLYGGIFTDRPMLIAQSIKRPLTPFIHHLSFHCPNGYTKNLFFEDSSKSFDFDSSYSVKKYNS